MKTDIIVGIDASRNRSGGAIAHLIGVLSNANPAQHGVKLVHLWAYQSLLDKLPNFPWLIKHSSPLLEGSLVMQLIWQLIFLAHEAKSAKCNILFSTDAATLCGFNPMVVLSQDMLSYEPGIMEYYGFSFARIRLLLILLLQNFAFRRSKGVIFLTYYAGRVIQNVCGELKNTAFIPHGVDSIFTNTGGKNWQSDSMIKEPISCMYVSGPEMYKHQWIVVEAIAHLRNKGHNVTLTLIGSGSGKAQEMLSNSIQRFDPSHNFIRQLNQVPHVGLPAILSEANVFIFASSCENLPITLIEGMAMGLPIACSNRGPMPEVLGGGGIYFDPMSFNSIALAVEEIILNGELRDKIAQTARNLSLAFSWQSCADKTFAFIASTHYKEIKDL